MKIHRIIIASFSILACGGEIARADLSVTFGGDVNFNKNRQPPMADGADISGKKISFEETTAGLRPLLDGDVNFANIETVVTENKNLSAQHKSFVFRSHPNAIRHLLDIGFNLFSLANNHSADHGIAGLSETLHAMMDLAHEGRRFGYAGVEKNRDDFSLPHLQQVGGHTIAFAAIGITDSSFRAGKNRPGIMSYNDDADLELVLKGLREIQADLKILSIHSGIEMKTTTEPDQRLRFEKALKEGDVDLILGTHPHVVRPVALIDGRAVFYSLGNYLMLGAADTSRQPPGSDYGLMGKAHFGWDASARRLKVQAVEVIPLTQMHIKPRPLDARAAADRVSRLNSLSASDLGTAKAMRFQLRQDGSGVACINQGLALSARAKAVCQ